MDSNFTPAGLIILLAGVFGILAGPRRYLIAIVLGVSFVISMRNHIVVFGLNFMPHRVLVVALWLRLISRGDFRDVKWNSIDKVFVLLAVWGTIAYVALWGTFASLVYRLGIVFDMVGLYFGFRPLVKTWDDVLGIIKGVAVVTVIVAAGMTIELLTQKNVFSLLGEVDEGVWERKGRFRCRGAFGHAIGAGIYGASLTGLWLGCLRSGKGLRFWGILGLLASTAITGASGSSTPALTYAVSFMAFGLWTFRAHLRLMRWGFVVVLIGLQLVMKSPVWSLLGRVNVVGGSTGYHRYLLVDTFFKTVHQWWWIGMEDTKSWAPVLWDVCNQYVLEGVRGGILRLALFLVLLALCFREVGRARVRLEAIALEDSTRPFIVWSVGVMLFAHCIAFLGYDYWDQILVVWYLFLAVAAGLGTVADHEEDLHDEANETALLDEDDHSKKLEPSVL